LSTRFGLTDLEFHYHHRFKR